MKLNTIKVIIIVLTITVPILTNAFAATLAINDHNGDRIELDAIPKRIATIATMPDSMIISIDSGPQRLKGVPFQSKKAMTEGIMGQFFPMLIRISDKVIDKGSPNIEELLKLELDLVFQWARKQKSLRLMRNVGLQAAGLKIMRHHMAETWLSDMGILMGKPERAQNIINWHREISKKVRDKIQSIPELERPTVLYLAGVDKVAGPSGHLADIIERAGGRNMVDIDKRLVTYDTELLLKWDPDIIFIHNFHTQKLPQDFFQNPLFADMKAIKQRRVYKVPAGGARWDSAGQEQALTLDWMTRVIHGPDILSGTLRAAIQKAYPFLYGHQVTDSQIDQILLTEINHGSFGYAQIVR